MASEPYTAELPPVTTSTRSMRSAGKVFTSGETPVLRTSPPTCRRPLTSTRVRAVPRPRRSSRLRPDVPPRTQGTIIFPGFDGAAEWGGQAWDARTGRLIVNSNEMAWILTMVPLKPGAALGERLYQVNCAVCD